MEKLECTNSNLLLESPSPNLLLFLEVYRLNVSIVNHIPQKLETLTTDSKTRLILILAKYAAKTKILDRIPPPFVHRARDNQTELLEGR